MRPAPALTLEATSWRLPRIDWEAPLAAATPPPGARLLARWPPTEFENTATDCFSLDDQIWIWQPEVGAVRFSVYEPRLSASLWPGGDAAWFREVLHRSWLPAIYPLWGRQVLHASAALSEDSGGAVAFTGATHAGKSTIAYGMGRRPRWRQLCDDTLAFSISTAESDRALPLGSVLLHPLTQQARLRPASADHFGVADRFDDTIDWPARTPLLRAVCVLAGDPDCETPPSFTRLRTTEALPVLLQQAYALSFGIPQYNQQLMKDYLALASAVPVYRLRYRQSFDLMDALFAAVERHLGTELGVR